MRKGWLFFALLLVVAHAHTSDVTLIKAKRYLDVRRGHYLSPANFLIEDGKISAINPKTIPKDARVLALPTLTLLPGLMDMHVHLPIDMKKDFMLDFVMQDAATATLIGAKNAKTILEAGFTTVRDAGQIYPGITFVDVALARASDQGWIAAPHIIPAGHALSTTGGHMDPSGLYRTGLIHTSYKTGIADGPDEVVKAVRFQIENGAKVIKAAATAGIMSNEPTSGEQQYSFEELKAMVDEATRHHVFVAVHAHGAEGINNAIKAGVRSIEHGSLLDDESIRLMKLHGTFLVPTTHVFDAADLSILPDNMKEKVIAIRKREKQHIAIAIRSGVPIVFGTDTPVFAHGRNAEEFQSMVDLGMTPLTAIQTATINAAKMMDIKDRGELKPHLLADIIGVEGDPLKDVRVLEHVQWVMKSGTVYKTR